MEKFKDSINAFNKKQCDSMKGSIHDKDEFKWDDDLLFSKLLCNFSFDKSATKEFKSENLDVIISLFDDYSKSKISLDDLKEKEESLYNSLKNEVKLYNDKHDKYDDKVNIERVYPRKNNLDIAEARNKIYITGEAGIGKSFLLYQLYKLLNEEDKPVFVSFGKYDEYFSFEHLDDIVNYNGKEIFYVIIDAINEYKMDGLKKVKDFISKLKDKNNIKLIVSYRENSMILEDIAYFNDLFKKYKYEFEGVSVDDALENMISKYGLEVLKYDSYINFQNPLYLRSLRKALENGKMIKDTENSISQVTFLYEHLFKEYDDGKRLWELTKTSVSKYMYDNCSKTIEIDAMKKILGTDFLMYTEKMISYGLLAYYDNGSEPFYILTIDFFNDCLIARQLWNDIKGKTNEDIIKIINSKIKKIYSVSTAFIIALFDYYKNNYKQIMSIIMHSELKHDFSYKDLKLINFKLCGDIDLFQKTIPINIEEAIVSTSGYNNKPFNCTNYLNREFLKQEKINALSSYSYYHPYKNYMLRRCKFIIALLKQLCPNRLKLERVEYDEYFWFSFWNMSTSHHETNYISRKSVYEFCVKNNEYYDELVKMYKVTSDDYIKDSIVEIICSSDKKIINKYNSFLLSIYNDCEELSSIRLVRIDNVLFGGRRLYIEKNKSNLLINKSKTFLDDNAKQILSTIDIYNKDLLPWRYFHGTNDSCYINLMVEDKVKVKEFNDFINGKYKCLLKSADNCKITKAHLIEEYGNSINEEVIKKDDIFILYYDIFCKTAIKYNVDIENIPQFNEYSLFDDSAFCKVAKISMHILEGTLMCNYYALDFNMDDNQIENKLGYSTYNRYQYDDSFPMFYQHPLSKHNQLVDDLDDILIKKIEQKEIKEAGWESNKSDIKKNLAKLITPVIKKSDKWYLLAGWIRFICNDPNSKFHHKWIDEYIISSSYNSEKSLNGNGDRYITIEWLEYKKSIIDYKNINCDIINTMEPIIHSDGILPANILTLPPAKLVRDMKLIYDQVESTWKDSNGDNVILCNNNNKHRYSDVVTGSMYISEKYYEKIKESIKYYSFTTRSLTSGYCEESEFHYEFDNKGHEIHCFDNSKQYGVDSDEKEIFCYECPHGQAESEEEYKINQEKIRAEREKIIKDFKIEIVE